MLAAGGDPGRLRATLDAVRDQPSPQIELLVVTFDGGESVARDAAADDTRVRFLRAADVSTARTLGVRESRAAHVLVAGPGDLYPSGALADLVPALTADEVLLLSDSVEDPERADLLVRPDLARAPYLGRLVLPRALATEVITAATDPDGMPIALAVLARGVVPTPYAVWRDGRGSRKRFFTHRHDPLTSLGARVAADRASLGAVSGPAREQRALGALAALRDLLDAAEGADPSSWDLLVEHARSLVDLARDQLESLDLVPRVLAALAAEGRRDELVGFAGLVGDRSHGEDLPTRVVDGRVIADVPVEVAEEFRLVGEHESALVAQARRLVVEDGVLQLELFVGVRHVDQTAAPVVGARLVDGDRSLPLLVRTGSDPAVTRWMDENRHDHDAGVVVASIEPRHLTPGSWEIHLDWSDGDLYRAGVVTEVLRGGSASRPAFAVSDSLSVALRARHGRVALHAISSSPSRRPEDEGNTPTLSRVELVNNELRLTVPGDIDQVRLVGPDVAVEGRAGSAGFWSIPLEAEVWGTGTRPLPSGGYRLRLLRGGAQVPVVTSAPLTDRLPEDLRTEAHRIQLLAAGEGLAVRLDAPLADDELGSRAGWRLRERYLAATEPLDPNLVYFQSFTGQGVGDHPRAIAAELRRRRPDLDLRWLVNDSSARVPEGLTPVLLRSREWYDVLARAQHIVTNIELERWFRRRDGQQILQTFHGYPSKAMGLSVWEPRGLLPSQIERQLDATSRIWNNLLTPDPEMDQYYRRDYAYDGTILALGSPRNDELVLPSASAVRDEVRARLGIKPGQRAVLYAPTWRDDLATNFRSAEAVHHLDVEKASAALGDDWVLLLRGHRFHAPSGSRGSRVIDVTTYPEINELILAADVGVFDYSSLRFDFALTGRPMVFLVPDLEEYADNTRGFLWDYRETAPGPLVATTEEVVGALRDLDGLGARYAADLAAFNTRYNGLQDGKAAERVVDGFFASLL